MCVSVKAIKAPKIPTMTPDLIARSLWELLSKPEQNPLIKHLSISIGSISYFHCQLLEPQLLTLYL